jgi:hypothetical protein
MRQENAANCFEEHQPNAVKTRVLVAEMWPGRLVAHCSGMGYRVNPAGLSRSSYQLYSMIMHIKGSLYTQYIQFLVACVSSSNINASIFIYLKFGSDRPHGSPP